MTVEPVFGIIKEIMGFRRFLLRGEDQANGEWLMVCSAYNLKRMFNLEMESKPKRGLTLTKQRSIRVRIANASQLK